MNTWIQFSFSFTRALGLLVFLPLDLFALGFGFRLIIAILMGFCALNHIVVIHNSSVLAYAAEFMLGFMIALPILMIIQATDLWSDLYESMRGQTAGSIADPLFQGETSYLTLLSKSLIWLSLISVGVLETIFVQYIRSFQISMLELSFWQKNILIISEVLSAAMKLVVPFAIIFLVVELMAIFSAKILPGVSLLNEIFTVKMIIGGIGMVTVLGYQPLSSLKVILDQLWLF